MSNSDSIIDFIIAAFVFVLSFIIAILFPFLSLFALNHQEWLGFILGSFPIVVLCLVVRKRSKAAFYGALGGYAIFVIGLLQRLIGG